MKKLLYLVFVALLFVSCGNEETKRVEKVYMYHESNGTPWIIYYYDVKGSDSVWVAEKWFHDNGALNLEGNIKDGKREGEFKSYYPSGRLYSVGAFVDGKREGRGLVYHENGQLNIDGDYHDGKPYGLWKFYDTEGNLLYTNEF